MYGIVDANYGTRTSTISANIDGEVETMKSKVTGLTDGATNGLSGSRWGLRGSEDLGGGLKANFVLESAVTVNDGGGNSSFARRSLVGVAGGFGSVDLGREYTPAFSAASATDVTGTDGYGTTNVAQGISAAQWKALDPTLTDVQAAEASAESTAGFQVRRSNSINYTSPNFGGLVVKAQIARNNTKSASTATAKDNGLGLSATYSAGPLMVALAVDQQKRLAAEGKTSTTVVGGTYDLGMAKLFANLHQTKFSDTAVGSTDYAKGRELNVGVQVPMGAITLLAGVGQNKLTRGDATGSVSAKGNDYILGANYAMSKRTTAYFRTGTKDQLKFKVEDGSVRVKTTGYHIGVRHTF
jgi:predicted porin